MFDAKLEVERICEFIRKYFKDNGLTGVVLGISGGVILRKQTTKMQNL